MSRTGLGDLAESSLPEGFRFKPSAAGREQDYLRVMRRTLAEDAGEKWFRETFSGDPEYDPANLFIVCRGDDPVAAAAAWQREWKNEKAGLVHMMGVDPSCRRLGLGRALVLRVLHRSRERGFRRVFLLTEDFRIPALSLYLTLGFRPEFLHWTHRMRWKKVIRRVNEIACKH